MITLLLQQIIAFANRVSSISDPLDLLQQASVYKIDNAIKA
jgi:hypothetical protein